MSPIYALHNHADASASIHKERGQTTGKPNRPRRQRRKPMQTWGPVILACATIAVAVTVIHLDRASAAAPTYFQAATPPGTPPAARPTRPPTTTPASQGELQRTSPLAQPEQDAVR